MLLGAVTGDRSKVRRLLCEGTPVRAGLIQLAGAFVHLQKHRRRPAAALLRLAAANLSQYRVSFDGLPTNKVIEMIQPWLARVEQTESVDSLISDVNAPRLVLQTAVEMDGPLPDRQPLSAGV